MTQKLTNLFNLPENNNDNNNDIAIEDAVAETKQIIPTLEQLEEVDAAIDKIDSALPLVHKLDATDSELDALSELAQSTFKDLIDLGMNVEARYCGTILSTASAMLGHALNAKEAKIDRKLKTVDLQLKKMRIDKQNDSRGGTDEDGTPVGKATVLDRTELLNEILGRVNADKDK